MWSEKELAYFAGILDGEGSISIEKVSPFGRRKKQYYVHRLVIINTDFSLMQWLNKTFGGKIQTRKKIANRKTVYNWVIMGDRMSAILIACHQFLIIKREKAELIIKFRETVGRYGENVSDETLAIRASLYDRLKILNKQGSHNSSALLP